MKKIFLLTFISFSTLIFSQASGSGKFDFTVKFEKEIPVSNLKVYCYEKSGNTITSINLKIDKINNTITINGTNHYVVGVKFPTIFFSYTDTVKLNQKTDKTVERKIFFYLVSGFQVISYYQQYLNKEIKFSRERPNIFITSKNKNDDILEIQNLDNWAIETYHDFKENLNISNSALKLN